MNKKLLLFLIILFIYNLIYKLILISQGQIAQYIYNPIAWMILTVIAYMFFGHVKSSRFRYKDIVLPVIIISSLFYNIIFYLGGLFVGYVNNPYDVSFKGLIINVFCVIFVVLMKEYIRSATINVKINHDKAFYLFIISIIFIISDINLLSIIKKENIVTTLFDKDVIQAINYNFFLNYLVINGSYKASFFCRLIIILPTLIIGITPNYDWLVIILFSMNFPFIGYLIIDYLIAKKAREMPIRIVKKYEPRYAIALFTFMGILIVFTLGFFPIKPLTVMSNSMSPYFEVGYVVFVENIEYDSIKVGDVVQYKNGEYTVIHRVVQIYIDNGVKKMIFKGDNNKNIDSKPVIEEQIIGRLKYKIPYIGYPSYLFNKIVGILIGRN